MSAKAKRTRKARGAARGSTARERRPLDPALNVRGETPYVAVPVRVPVREWGKANALVGEVFDWLGERGIAPAGPSFHRYRTIGDAETPFDLEVGVPVAAPVEGDGRVVAGAMPAGGYATAVHHGHPDRLQAAHDELRAWVREQGLRLAIRHEAGREVWDGRFESFLTDPAERPDPERWSIEIAYLLDLDPAEADGGAT